MTLKLKEVTSTIDDDETNPFFRSSTKMMNKIRDQWLKGIHLEKKLDQEYRKDFEDEITDFGKKDVDEDEERWKNRIQEGSDGFTEPRDFKDEESILNGIQNLLNQMTTFVPDRPHHQKFFTDDDVDKIDLYKMKQEI